MEQVKLIKDGAVKVLTNPDLIVLLKSQGWKVEGEKEIKDTVDLEPKKRGRKPKTEE